MTRRELEEFLFQSSRLAPEGGIAAQLMGQPLRKVYGQSSMGGGAGEAVGELGYSAGSEGQSTTLSEWMLWAATANESGGGTPGTGMSTGVPSPGRG